MYLFSSDPRKRSVKSHYPANIYMFKVNNRNTRKRGEYDQS